MNRCGSAAMFRSATIFQRKSHPSRAIIIPNAVIHSRGFSSSLHSSSLSTTTRSSLVLPYGCNYFYNNNNNAFVSNRRHYWMYDDSDDDDDDDDVDEDYISPRKKMSFDGPVNPYGIPESMIQKELQKVEHALQYAEQEPYGPDRGIWSIHEYFGYTKVTTKKNSNDKKVIPRPRFKKKKARNLMIRLIHRRHALRLGHFGLNALPCRVITESFLGHGVPHHLVRISRPKAREILLELWFDGYSDLIAMYKAQIESKLKEQQQNDDDALTNPIREQKIINAPPKGELYLFNEYEKKIKSENKGVENEQAFDEQFGEKEEEDEEFKIDSEDDEEESEDLDDYDAKIRWRRRWRH